MLLLDLESEGQSLVVSWKWLESLRSAWEPALQPGEATAASHFLSLTANLILDHTRLLHVAEEQRNSQALGFPSAVLDMDVRTQTDPSLFLLSASIESKKVKVLAAQSCLTLCDPMGCSLSGPTVYGIFQARILEWVNSLLQGIFLTQALNLGLLHCRQVIYCLRHHQLLLVVV